MKVLKNLRGLEGRPCRSGPPGYVSSDQGVHATAHGVQQWPRDTTPTDTSGCISSSERWFDGDWNRSSKRVCKGHGALAHLPRERVLTLRVGVARSASPPGSSSFVGEEEGKMLLSAFLLGGPGQLQVLEAGKTPLQGAVCSVSQSCLTLWPARLLCPWGFLGKNTRVGCHFLP